MGTTPADTLWMQHALRVAERARGRTSPNPAVGCVLVKDGALLAAAATAPGGRPHAETEALRLAGEHARGATAYVTLEPCAHHGNTPPCAQALITAGIARIVIGVADPNPHVNGQGAEMLRKAGIEMVTGVCEKEAQALHAGFLSRMTRGVPLVSVKAATSADGYMMAKNHEPRWITGEVARRTGHYLRATHEAILTGSATILADNPLLTCRLPGLESVTPLRLVLDRTLRISPDAHIFDATEYPTWLFTTIEDGSRHAPYIARGAKIITLKEKDIIPQLLASLGAGGINSLLVEAGPTLSHAFLETGYADTLYWFYAEQALGPRGEALFAPEPWISGWNREENRHLGRDGLAIFRK